MAASKRNRTLIPVADGIGSYIPERERGYIQAAR